MKLSKWQYGALNIYQKGKRDTLKYFFSFVLKNHAKIPGDIIECGVFQGRSLLGMACALRAVLSKKIVYGFDTFSGFPCLGVNDNPSKFRLLYKEKKISKRHYLEHLKFLDLRKKVFSARFGASKFSTSGDFSNTSKSLIYKKLKYLKLKNVRLIEGDFEKTMVKRAAPLKIMAALIDCDLYKSHQICLPFVWERLVPGGYVFLDEYYSLKFPGARIAINKFFADKIEKPIKHPDDGSGFERWYVKKR